MGIYGYVWVCMGFYGCVLGIWLCMDIYGFFLGIFG